MKCGLLSESPVTHCQENTEDHNEPEKMSLSHQGGAQACESRFVTPDSSVRDLAQSVGHEGGLEQKSQPADSHEHEEDVAPVVGRPVGAKDGQEDAACAKSEERRPVDAVETPQKRPERAAGLSDLRTEKRASPGQKDDAGEKGEEMHGHENGGDQQGVRSPGRTPALRRSGGLAFGEAIW